MSVNIIMNEFKDEDPRRHRPAQDGKSPIDIMKALRNESEKDAIDMEFKRLKAAGIRCEIKGGDEKYPKPCIIGQCKGGQPFAVYMRIVEKGDDFVFLTTTRYKGTEVDMKPPLEVIK